MLNDSSVIRLDAAGLMADTLGGADHGVTQAELDGIAPAVSQGHERLATMKSEHALGFWDLPGDTQTVDRIKAATGKLAGRFENLVVFGIGGSALGMTAVAQALLHPYHNLDSRVRNGAPRLFVVDNIDPNTLAALFDVVDVRETLFVVITKSGSTAETMTEFGIAVARLRDALGSDYADHVVAVTDPEKGDLRKIAREEKFLSFDVPSNVGGRFSVLSPVGLFPAAMVGVDIHAMLAGAAQARTRMDGSALDHNAAYLYAATQYLLATKKGKPISVMMPYCDRLAKVGNWYSQLWAESLGKRVDRAGKVVNAGPTPVSALGVTDQHSQIQLYVEGPFDKVITFLAVEERATDLACEAPYRDVGAMEYLRGHTVGELFDAERQGTRVAVTAAGRPNATFLLENVSATSLGALFFVLETATALSGELYDIDAFNQPGVEAGKTAAYALMGRPGYEERLREIEAAASRESTRIVG